MRECGGSLIYRGAYSSGVSFVLGCAAAGALGDLRVPPKNLDETTSRKGGARASLRQYLGTMTCKPATHVCVHTLVNYCGTTTNRTQQSLKNSTSLESSTFRTRSSCQLRLYRSLAF